MLLLSMQAVAVQRTCNQGENGELGNGNADEPDKAHLADAPEPGVRRNKQAVGSDEGSELADAYGKELAL